MQDENITPDHHFTADADSAAGGAVTLAIDPAFATTVEPGRAQSMGSVAAALLGHAALIGVLLWSPVADGLGGGVTLDAIAVTITDGAALESTDVSTSRAAAAADNAVATAAVAPREESAAAPDLPETQTAKSLAMLTAPEAAFQLPVTPPDIAPADEQKLAETQADARSKPAPDAEAAPLADSGAAARGTAWEAVAAPAAAAAPPGAVQAYARSIMAAVARHKPRPQANRGTTRVRFTVGPDGNVTDATVLATSGDQLLDRAALDAVKRAQFPAPPVALSRAETTFVLPFHFR